MLSIKAIEVADCIISIGDCVELTERHNGERDGDFLKIKDIRFFPASNQVTLSGFILSRTRRSGGLLPHKLNELFIQSTNIDTDTITCNDIDLNDDVLYINEKPIKRDLIITNQLYPALSFRDRDFRSLVSHELKRDIFKNGQLICRWVIATAPTGPGIDSPTLPRCLQALRINEDQADLLNGQTDWKLVEHWRGPIPNDRQFTFGDGFCGAGGVSVGATQAGLRVTFAFDMDRNACDTYQMNNPATVVWNAPVDQLVSLIKERPEEFRVDILHVSPPCQAYSLANTQAGQRDPNAEGGRRDDMNQAASFAVSQLVDLCKPRILTMEQTNGIFADRSINYLRGVIAQLTSKDFSVSYGVLDFTEYGGSQHRKRLIIMASCPGSRIPRFVKPTFGPRGERPYRTINDCVVGINRSHENHDPTLPIFRGSPAGNKLLDAMIMTNGTRDHHPTDRPFSVRELASLMTFPLDFRFAPHLSNGILKRQIGNSVPPSFATALLEHIKDHLADEDDKFVRAKEWQLELLNMDVDDSSSIATLIGPLSDADI